MNGIRDFLKSLFTIEYIEVDAEDPGYEAGYDVEMMRDLSFHGYDCGPGILYFSSHWQGDRRQAPAPPAGASQR